MRRPPLLGQSDIVDEGAGRGELGAAEIAEAVERANPVEIFEAAAGGIALEPGIRQRRQGRLPLGEEFEERRAGQHALGQQDLARHQAGEIAGERGFAGRRKRKPAGRQIEPGKTDLAPGLGEAGQIIVPARVEQSLFGQGAGGHDADDRPPHRSLPAAPLGFGRILDLVAHRHLEPGADQAGEIGFGGVDRDAAHRNIGALVPAALGQRDVERLRRRDGVIEEQLVEIPHPKEQQTAGVRLFDLVILDHHRRGGRHGGNGIRARMFVHRRTEHRGRTRRGV